MLLQLLLAESRAPDPQLVASRLAVAAFAKAPRLDPIYGLRAKLDDALALLTVACFRV